MHYLSKRLVVLCCFCFVAISGCATNGNPKDPLEPFNRGVYRFNRAVDDAVLKPVATGYKAAVPQPMRTGVTNFFSNIGDLWVIVNDILQLKVSQAASDTGRFLINSTVGIFGLVDVASDMGLEKHNEDLGQTLGHWGIGDGPYLVLPFFGPSTVRDSFGLVVQLHYDPLINNVDNIRARNSILALRVVNDRANLLGSERLLDEAALDPYEFLRDAYLQRRRSLIKNGNEKDGELKKSEIEDDMTQDSASLANPATNVETQTSESKELAQPNVAPNAAKDSSIVEPAQASSPQTQQPISEVREANEIQPSSTPEKNEANAK